MYKRLHTILNDNKVIYNIQFGFIQHYFKSHVLNDTTENIRKALDETYWLLLLLVLEVLLNHKRLLIL